jgi:hypothetical protein
MRSGIDCIDLMMLNSMGRKSPMYTHESTSSSDSSDLKKILLQEFSLHHKVLKPFNVATTAVIPTGEIANPKLSKDLGDIHEYENKGAFRC